MFQDKYPGIEIKGFVVLDRQTKVSKGFGFLNFPEDQQATQCIKDCDFKLKILSKKIKLVKVDRKAPNDKQNLQPIPT